MHEFIIANKILEDIKKYASLNKISSLDKIISVSFEVGDLAHLSAEELKETLKSRVKFKININRKKAVVKCKCGYKGEPKILDRGHHSLLFVCPECDDIPEIVDGEDIKIMEIKVIDK